MTFAVPCIVALVLAAGAASPSGATSEAPPSPGAAQIAVGRYLLERRPRGEYEASTEAFVARIAVDGAVTFKNRFRLPGPAVWPVLVAAEALRQATGGREDLPAPRQVGARPSLKRPTLIVSDEDLRRDPHHAAKMTFLETTKDFREGLRLANDRSALVDFESRVRAAATDRSRAAAQRREDLFELWLECDETARGAPARATVEAIARQIFPASSPGAYAPAELTRLNARAPAGLRFSPYPRPDAGEAGKR